MWKQSLASLKDQVGALATPPIGGVGGIGMADDEADRDPQKCLACGQEEGAEEKDKQLE